MLSIVAPPLASTAPVTVVIPVTTRLRVTCTSGIVLTPVTLELTDVISSYDISPSTSNFPWILTSDPKVEIPTNVDIPEIV